MNLRQIKRERDRQLKAQAKRQKRHERRQAKAAGKAPRAPAGNRSRGPTTMENPTYLGDAVYAYFDGNGIELRLNAHDQPCTVYLEPETLQNLIEFAQAAGAP